MLEKRKSAIRPVKPKNVGVTRRYLSWAATQPVAGAMFSLLGSSPVLVRFWQRLAEIADLPQDKAATALEAALEAAPPELAQTLLNSADDRLVPDEIRTALKALRARRVHG
jgi:hypothetical protein